MWVQNTKLYIVEQNFRKKGMKCRQNKWPPEVIAEVCVKTRNKSSTFQSNAFIIKGSSQEGRSLWLTLHALFPAVPNSHDSSYQLLQSNLRPFYYSIKPTFQRHKAESRSWLSVCLCLIAPQSKFMNSSILTRALFVSFCYSPLPKI